MVDYCFEAEKYKGRDANGAYVDLGGPYWDSLPRYERGKHALLLALRLLEVGGIQELYNPSPTVFQQVVAEFHEVTPQYNVDQVVMLALSARANLCIVKDASNPKGQLEEADSFLEEVREFGEELGLPFGIGADLFEAIEEYRRMVFYSTNRGAKRVIGT